MSCCAQGAVGGFGVVHGRRVRMVGGEPIARYVHRGSCGPAEVRGEAAVRGRGTDLVAATVQEQHLMGAFGTAGGDAFGRNGAERTGATSGAGRNRSQVADGVQQRASQGHGEAW